MCGIFGTTLNYKSPLIENKLKRTSFRGPNQLGYNTFSNNVTFGHNRLSIIDLDPRSNQPFTYLENIHLVFNGEIYNFLSIKETLQKKGYQFNTTSDTEVVCAAYLEYGYDCVNHFNGMFAFVIYDEKSQTFFGARDRLGQKPFYYYHNGKDFEFSSQISSIQMYNDNLTISSKAIQYYLSWGTIPDPYSIFNEIQKLKAGYSFTFDLTSGTFNTKQYWDINYKELPDYKKSFNDAKEELDHLMTDAVKKRMYADVPVGVFLSGGIDSSLVAAMAQKTATNPIKTFNVKFTDKNYDESEYAEKVSKYLGTEHTIIECNYDEGIDLIDTFSHYYDEPFADASAIPSMLLSKHTSKKVTVVLSGDAGDENFIGYHRYNWIKRIDSHMKWPYIGRKASGALLKAINKKYTIASQILALKDTNQAYLHQMNASVLNPDTFNPNEGIEELEYLNYNKKGLLERVSDFDLKTYLNWDINTKVDRASMAFSLEVRAPLLDYRIVEFARSLPTDYKYKNGEMKFILKELLYEYAPKDYFDRPKSGFTMPFANWFRNDLKDYVMSQLNQESLKKIPMINPIQVKNIIDDHMSGKANMYPEIWKLLVLKQWLDNNKGYSIV